MMPPLIPWQLAKDLLRSETNNVSATLYKARVDVRCDCNLFSIVERCAAIQGLRQVPATAAQQVPAKTDQKTSSTIAPNVPAKTAQKSPVKAAQKVPAKSGQQPSVRAAQKTPPKPLAQIPHKPKLDLGYVTVEAAAAVVVFPRFVLTAPEMGDVADRGTKTAREKRVGD